MLIFSDSYKFVIYKALRDLNTPMPTPHLRRVYQ